MIGKTIGQYEITAELGKGGMGVVYQATDLKIGRTVALKFLPEDLTRDEEAKARFLREARTAGQLDHPNVCTIHDIAETPEGQMYLVMAHYPGGSLEDRLKDGGVTQEDSLDILGQIASGLDAAHAAGIVHRDIKPANILFSGDGLVKIVDFGLAKLSDQTKVTVTGTTLGTGSYMAPEQASGEEAEAAADIWSLTVVAYEMLTGERPFQGDFLPAVAYAIVHTEPAVPSERNPGLESGIDVALLRGLNKDPALRFRPAGDLVAALKGEEVSSPRAAPVAKATLSRKPRPGVRGPWLRWLGLALLGVLVAAAGFYAVSRLGGSEPAGPLSQGPTWSRTLAILPFSFQGDPDRRDLADQIPQLLAERLYETGDLHLAAGDSLLPYLTAEEREDPFASNLTTITNRLQADLTMTGKITATGGNLQVTLEVEGSNGTTRTINGRVDPDDDLLLYVDQLTLKSVAAVYPDPWHELIRVAAASSNNWVAVKHFIKAELGRRFLYRPGWSEEITTCLEADSTLALAHFNLAHLRMWSSDERGMLESARRAQQHAGSLPHFCRDLVEALIQYFDNDMDLAENTLNRVLLTNPEFLDAWLGLAYIAYDSNHLRGRSLLETRALFEKVQELDPMNRNPDVALPFLWSMAGETELLRDDLTGGGRYRLKPGNRALMAFLGDDPELQESLGDSINLNALYTQQAIILSWPQNQRNLLRFLDQLEKKTEADLPQGWIAETQAQVHAGLGHWDLAMAEFATMPEDLEPWRLTYQAILTAMPFAQATSDEIAQLMAEIEKWRPRANVTIYQDPYGLGDSRYAPDFALNAHMKQLALGLLQMRLGDLPAAGQTLSRMEGLPVPPGNEKMIHELVLSLRAWIAYAAGRPQEVLEILEGSAQYSLANMGYSGLHDRAFQRYVRALALMEMGRLEEAIPWLEFIDEKTERNQIFVAPACRQLGGIYEKLGNPEAAVENYRIFLDLYRDCDERYRPRVEEVAARVDALTAG